jgi:hypothetical protein
MKGLEPSTFCMARNRASTLEPVKIAGNLAISGDQATLKVEAEMAVDAVLRGDFLHLSCTGIAIGRAAAAAMAAHDVRRIAGRPLYVERGPDGEAGGATRHREPGRQGAAAPR